MTIAALINLLIVLLVAGLIFYCIWWFVGYIAVPEPFNKVIRVVVALVALLFLLGVLLSLLGIAGPVRLHM